MAESIRVDTASLIPGSLVVGDAGLGVVGADVPVGSFFAASATDPSKEYRALVTTPPPVGTFTPEEDGTYTYVGPDTTFQYQLYIDGVPSGAPVTAPLSGNLDDLAGAATGQATATGSLSKQVNLSGDAVAVATAAMASEGFDSIRVDEDSLIAGAIVVGDLGHGVLGSQIPVPIGLLPPSFLWNDIDPVADANKEIRGYITRWAEEGDLYVYEDGSFAYLGPSTDFDYQLYVDGIAVGSPVTVDIHFEVAADLAGAAAAAATASGSLGSIVKPLSGAAAGQVTAAAGLSVVTPSLEIRRAPVLAAPSRQAAVYAKWMATRIGGP